MFHSLSLLLSSWTDVNLSLFNLSQPFPYFHTDVRFNDRWHTFTPSAAKGGQVAPMAEAI